jgi:hypothetical protein
MEKLNKRTQRIAIGSMHWEGCEDCLFHKEGCHVKSPVLEELMAYDGDNLWCTAYKPREPSNEDQ